MNSIEKKLTVFARNLKPFASDSSGYLHLFLRIAEGWQILLPGSVENTRDLLRCLSLFKIREGTKGTSNLVRRKNKTRITSSCQN